MCILSTAATVLCVGLCFWIARLVLGILYWSNCCFMFAFSNSMFLILNCSTCFCDVIAVLMCLYSMFLIFNQLFVYIIAVLCFCTTACFWFWTIRLVSVVLLQFCVFVQHVSDSQPFDLFLWYYCSFMFLHYSMFLILNCSTFFCDIIAVLVSLYSMFLIFNQLFVYYIYILLQCYVFVQNVSDSELLVLFLWYYCSFMFLYYSIFLILNN